MPNSPFSWSRSHIKILFVRLSHEVSGNDLTLLATTCYKAELSDHCEQHAVMELANTSLDSVFGFLLYWYVNTVAAATFFKADFLIKLTVSADGFS